MTDNNLVTLRVVGLGHKLTFDVSSSATIGEVKEQIENRTFLPAAYQRLIAHGKKLDHSNDEMTLADLGIQNRTSLMLLHNESYAADKDGVTKISELLKETDELSGKSDTMPRDVVHELVTQICCKIDGVETHGSDTLRAMRKQAIEKAEAVDRCRSSRSGDTKEQG